MNIASSLYILFVLACSEGREYGQILEVFNGGQWGEWAEEEFCPEHEFAIGYQMRVEETIVFGNDDTELNTVRLICAKGHHENGTFTSGEGFWGDWTAPLSCNQYPNQLFYITAFDLQVEKPQGSGDDTAANWIKFKCSQIVLVGENVTLEAEILDKHPGSAVCGLATKVEPQQGDGDDTSLNDVRLYCCEVLEETFNAAILVG